MAPYVGFCATSTVAFAAAVLEDELAGALAAAGAELLLDVDAVLVEPDDEQPAATSPTAKHSMMTPRRMTLSPVRRRLFTMWTYGRDPARDCTTTAPGARVGRSPSRVGVSA